MILYAIVNKKSEVQELPKAPKFFESKDEAATKIGSLPKGKQAGLSVQAYSLVKAVVV